MNNRLHVHSESGEKAYFVRAFNRFNPGFLKWALLSLNLDTSITANREVNTTTTSTTKTRTNAATNENTKQSLLAFYINL